MNVAKIQQSLPEMKRDGDTVLGSVNSELLFDETYVPRMGSVVPMIDFVPKLAQQLQESPEEVIKDLEEIRSCCEYDFQILAVVLQADILLQSRIPLASGFQSTATSCR